METSNLLETELRVFDENRHAWAETHLGKFVVIQQHTILQGFFDAYEDAFVAAVRQFGGDQSFLIKQIWKIEPVYCVA